MKVLGILSLLITVTIVMVLYKNQISGSNPAGEPQIEVAVESARQARGLADGIMIKKAISVFMNEKGRLPENLEELLEQGYLNRMPSGWKYDSVSGEIEPDR
jgi:hypothetical protein